MKCSSCYLCGSNSSKTLLVQRGEDPMLELIDKSLCTNDRRIVICSSCGFVYHDPTLETFELENLYDRYRSAVFRNEEPDAYFDRITSLPIESSFNYSKTKKIDSYIAKYTNFRVSDSAKKYFLDVGTGGGVFVKTFLDNSHFSWNAFGVEPTRNYAELASRRLNIEVKNKFYSHGLFPHSFDLITANKVLEHAQDPISFLKSLGHDLAFGGLIYVEVPSVREVFSLPSDHPQLSYDHLIFFSKETLRYMALAAGLKVLEINEIFLEGGEVDLNLIATIGKAPDASQALPNNSVKYSFRF